MNDAAYAGPAIFSLIVGLAMLVLYVAMIIAYFKLANNIKEMRDMMFNAHTRRVTNQTPHTVVVEEPIINR